MKLTYQTHEPLEELLAAWTDSPAFTLKSMPKMARIASALVAVAPKPSMPTQLRANASVSTLNEHAVQATRRKGRRLPQACVLESERTPTMGCMKRPESGPATKTRAISEGARPSYHISELVSERVA